MFTSLGFHYPRSRFRKLIARDRDFRKKQIIKALIDNPLKGIDEIGKEQHTHPYSIFKDSREIYSLAGLNFISRSQKRKLNKIKIIVDYIKKNNFATQREINRFCKTKVQDILDKGIFEAYELANVKFPFYRLNLHESAILSIKRESILFEKRIGNKLSSYGLVNRLVKTKRGVADLIFERKEKRAIIEIKNYKSHEVSLSDVKQVNKYLEDTGLHLGFIICLKKPKKDTFLIDKNRIYVLEESELDRILPIMDLW